MDQHAAEPRRVTSGGAFLPQYAVALAAVISLP
jgi:hypothetical protein